MLRASSAGLTTAFSSAISAFRPWKASCATRIVSAAIQQSVLSCSTQARGIRLKPAVLHPANSKGSQRPPSHSRSQVANEKQVQRDRKSQLRVTILGKPGGAPGRRARLLMTTRRPALRRVRRVVNSRLIPPIGSRTTLGGYSHAAGVDIMEAVFSWSRHSNGQREHGSHPPFQLHPSIEHRIRVTLGEDLGFKLIRLLRMTAAGRDLEESWRAYTAILYLQFHNPAVAAKFPSIPNAVLHRFARHLVRTKPITKSHFPRLLRVLQDLWDADNPLPIEAWNNLINFAGKGFRTGSWQEYRMALSIFRDMTKGHRPGAALSRRFSSTKSPVKPDLVTFNTLLTIASRSLIELPVAHAVSLFKKSGFTPDWITHMSLLLYHMRSQNLDGIRATVHKITAQNLVLPLAGVNAVMTAYAYSGRKDIALDIYRILQNNVARDRDSAAFQRAQNRLRKERLSVPRSLKPDVVTYTMVIQSMSYTGDFTKAFSTFHDFLSVYCNNGMVPASGAAFRALFQGFAKHAVDPKSPIAFLPSASKWNLKSLSLVYKLFLQLPTTAVPTRSTLYWIMTGFGKASGYDRSLLQQVWLELKNRYHPIKPSLFHQPRLRHLEKELFTKTHRPLSNILRSNIPNST